MTEVMNSLEPGPEDFGGGGAAADQDTVSLQVCVFVTVCVLRFLQTSAVLFEWKTSGGGSVQWGARVKWSVVDLSTAVSSCYVSEPAVLNSPLWLCHDIIKWSVKSDDLLTLASVLVSCGR